MKGAVDLITLIIIACMVVSIGLMLWFYLSTYYWQVTRSGENSTAKSLETLSSCMRVEEAAQTNFFIRNCGTGLITNNTLNVYLDDNLISASLNPASIDAGKTGTLILQGVWGLSIGQHTLRITNPNVETSALFEAELPDSCVLALDFDEGSGTIAYDKSSYNNDGTLINNPVWVDGKYGKALQFNDTGDYVNVQHRSNLNPVNTISISAWVILKVVQPPYSKGIVGKGAYSLFQDWDGPTAITFYVQNVTNGQMWNGKYNLPLNEWIHALGTYDGSNVKLYINGKLQDTRSFSGDLLTDSDPLRIGEFNGTIDSVRVYKKALTSDETLNFRLI